MDKKKPDNIKNLLSKINVPKLPLFKKDNATSVEETSSPTTSSKNNTNNGSTPNVSRSQQHTPNLQRSKNITPSNFISSPNLRNSPGPESISSSKLKPISTSSMEVSPPKPPRKISKPSITLKIPSAESLAPPPPKPIRTAVPPMFPPIYNNYRQYTPGGIYTIPMTAGTLPPDTFLQPNKASEFMFKQFAGFKDFTMNTAKSGLSFGEKFAFWMYNKMRLMSTQWFTHVFLLFVVFSYAFIGGCIFSWTEGAVEKKYEKIYAQATADIQVERSLVITRMKEAFMRGNNDYSETMYKELKRYEPIYAKYAVMPPNKTWNFWGSVFYAGTVFTTIGYGNITPHTHTGRAFTIAYAIIGIPLFLIVLADFGKLFTRGIKFLWAYVRRLYYTGSCRQVRRTAPVQEFMKGVKMVSDVAQNLRRPSQMMSPEELRKMGAYGSNLNIPETGGATPALSSYEIDEEFNLPISLALLILLGYILCGATVFCIWEDWTFFESCYFVFISMSTIGFGDIVPKHRMYMMASIVYLLFGLALTSMCINVVQEKLSNSFRQASAKLGATIGFQVEEDTGLVNAVSPPQSEIPEVHQPSGGKCKKS